MKTSGMGRYQVAAIQYEPVLFAKERNVRELLALTESAARAGARLIVLPEMATTGYCWLHREEVAAFVEPIPGPTTTAFGEIACRLRCYIVLGMAEVDPATDIYYNSAALIGPEGLIGKYRKTHPFVSDPLWARDGDLGLPVWETELGVLGIAICMDFDIMEPARILALKGADVICLPTAWPGEKCPSPHWMTRAFENGVYVVAANRIGTERGTVFSGGSCILDPDGSIQAMVDNEQGIVCGYVDLTRTGGKRCAGWPTGDRFADRRPEMYHGMVLNSYLWNPFLTGSLYNRQGLPPGKRSLVLAVQMRTPEDPAVALANVEALLAKFPPRDAEPDLVVLPELFSVGELATGDTIRGRAEPLSGPLAVGLERLAARWHVYLVAGLAELESGHFYNTAALFGPEGRLVGKYRKLHLDRRDREWADPGNLGLPVFDLPAGRVGLLIGYDALFPELARCLALAGVDIICCPSSVPGPRPIALGATAVSLPEPIYRGPNPTHWHLWRCRAGENGVYVIFANQWGKNSMGYSGIFHPDYYGYPRHEAVGDGEGDSVLALEVDTRDGWSGTVHLQNWLMGNRWAVNPVRTKDYLRLRQPYWYDIFVHRRPPVLERQLSCPMTRE